MSKESSSNSSVHGILIHGGARDKKNLTPKNQKKEEMDITKFLNLSVTNGFDLLKKDFSALEAIEAAIVTMEDSGVFNAGKGSVLTTEGKIEMDASMMYGKDLSAGSLGMVNGVKNPIKLARIVMEQTDHVLIASDGAIELARFMGMEIEKNKHTKESIKKFHIIKNKIAEKWEKNSKILKLKAPRKEDVDDSGDGDTVGAISIDKEANVASAVSTGGRWLKVPGRIGDSAIVGAGLYADNSKGACLCYWFWRTYDQTFYQSMLVI